MLENKLVGFSDADWAGDCDSRKSTSGFVFMYAGGPVSWGSKRQTCVALSTSEAEYVALSVTVQEGLWLHRMLNEVLDVPRGKGLLVFEDNRSCIQMTKNPIHHGRSKHIDIKFHFIRDEVRKGNVCVEYLETDKMVADAMTKPLPGPRFGQLRSMLGMSSVSIEGEC